MPLPIRVPTFGGSDTPGSSSGSGGSSGGGSTGGGTAVSAQQAAVENLLPLINATPDSACRTLLVKFLQNSPQYVSAVAPNADGSYTPLSPDGLATFVAANPTCASDPSLSAEAITTGSAGSSSACTQALQQFLLQVGETGGITQAALDQFERTSSVCAGDPALASVRQQLQTLQGAAVAALVPQITKAPASTCRANLLTYLQQFPQDVMIPQPASLAPDGSYTALSADGLTSFLQQNPSCGSDPALSKQASAPPAPPTPVQPWPPPQPLPGSPGYVAPPPHLSMASWMVIGAVGVAVVGGVAWYFMSRPPTTSSAASLLAQPESTPARLPAPEHDRSRISPNPRRVRKAKPSKASAAGKSRKK